MYGYIYNPPEAVFHINIFHKKAYCAKKAVHPVNYHPDKQPLSVSE
jgi:hypothetical protein